MIYTTEFAILKMKTDIAEYILMEIERKTETIKRNRKDLEECPSDPDWFRNQINNTEEEISALNSIMKQLTK